MTIQSAKEFSAVCSTSLYISAQFETIRLFIINKTQNTNIIGGYFTFCLYLLTPVHSTRPVAVSLWYVIISVLFEVCLHKDVNILHLCYASTFSFGLSKANSSKKVFGLVY